MVMLSCGWPHGESAHEEPMQHCSGHRRIAGGGARAEGLREPRRARVLVKDTQTQAHRWTQCRPECATNRRPVSGEGADGRRFLVACARSAGGLTECGPFGPERMLPVSLGCKLI